MNEMAEEKNIKFGMYIKDEQVGMGAIGFLDLVVTINEEKIKEPTQMPILSDKSKKFTLHLRRDQYRELPNGLRDLANMVERHIKSINGENDPRY